MAAPIGGLPYWEVRFDRDGRLLDDDGLVAALPGSGVRELFVFCHGWNSSDTGARALYAYTFGELAAQIDSFVPSWHGKAGVVGVFWPSMLFPEDAPDSPSTASTPAELATALAPAFAPAEQAKLTGITALLDKQPEDAEQLQAFHRLVGGLVTSRRWRPRTPGSRRCWTSRPARCSARWQGWRASRATPRVCPTRSRCSGTAPGRRCAPPATTR
ncbi:hypothetical protein GCM10025734_06140 [Kitasatospora paranensis]